MPTPRKTTKKTTKTRAATGADTAAPAATTGTARTVIYCHGIFNKPPEKQLRSEWDRALFGADQGERTRMAYWVDRERYPTPSGPGVRALGGDGDGATGAEWAAARLRDSVANSDRRRESAAFTRALETALRQAAARAAKTAAARGGPAIQAVGAKGLWRPTTDLLTKLFLADVNDFLFNRTKRERMVQTVKDRIATGGGPFVVIGHSQGSMITYQALMELAGRCAIELFVTLGSPLGLPPVTAELRKWHGQRLPFPPGVKRWLNVARDGDIVCADQTLADEYRTAGRTPADVRIADFVFPPAKAHDGGDYLRHPATRRAVMAAVDTARFQPVSPFTVARDLAGSLDEDATERVPVLVELADRTLPGTGPAPTAQDAVVRWIEGRIAPDARTKDAIHLEVLDHYVAAHLTRAEVESLAAELGQHYGAASPAVYRMFKNGRKKALLRQSVNTVQARTAQLGYQADGRGIIWAVLDTGIDREHPHFRFLPESNIAAAWDCTARGQVRQAAGRDANGHGTHVGGIIAGGLKDVGGEPGCDLIAVAPRARLVSYQVLADDGSGNDAWIIKAIDHIWAQNETARRLAIHGVNLSLGGPFDATSFGCGDSPLCASLLRLVRQGVLVVLAAGNEGSGEIVVDGTATAVALDLSIGDPANLDQGIAVGSVHPTMPHRYGTSYFSSRGPTSDGRLKPDVVAPGERIWSCRSGGRGPAMEDLYVALSGTSMAAPHVSGLLAGFLSARPEFIGYPDRVKAVLLAYCTDLERDRYHQGAGLPNLAKMLLNT